MSYIDLGYNALLTKEDPKTSWADLGFDINAPENNADITAQHNKDINTSKINNDANWTDDTTANTAIIKAETAQATADGKLVGFYQDTQPASGMYYGDIWIDTNGATPLDTTCIYRYQDSSGGYTPSGMTWVNTPTNSIGTAYLKSYTAQSTADGKIVTFYQTGEPSTEESSLGDMWVNANDGNKLFRYSGSNWVEVQDEGIATALANASTAQTTAEERSKVFRQTSAPTSGMTIGDAWIDTSDGDRPYNYDGSNWKQTLTIIDGGKITTGTINASVVSVINLDADEIQTGTLTGLTVRTAVSGARVELNGPNNRMDIRDSSRVRMRLDQQNLYFYNSSSNNVGQLYTDSSTDFNIKAPAGNYLKLIASSSSYAVVFINGSSVIGSVGINGIIMSSGKYVDTETLISTIWKNSNNQSQYIQFASSGLETTENFYAAGNLSCGGTKSFKIDHPLKPDTHYLLHSSIESDEMMNIYKGNGYIKNGICQLTMPSWFTPLNGDNKDDYSYSLTSIGGKNDLWVEKEMNNGKVVFAGTNDKKFSYVIYAVRHDKHAEKNRMKVEVLKNIKDI